jgi:16S rRNA (cytosine967-C5)-methyltransferase
MAARDYALFRLDQTPLPGWAKPVLRQSIPAPADPRDVGLSEQITIGVIKNQLHLLHLESYYSGRALKSIHPLVQKVLAIALYQLRFLTRVPASAAVDEAVKQARRFGQAHAAGFVNAILRKATREPEPPLPGRADAAVYAEAVLSHPREVFAKLSQLLGPEDALRFCEHSNEQPPTILRLFPGVTIDDLKLPEDITLSPHKQAGMYVVSAARPALLARLAEEGLAQVQDPTAALVAAELELEPGQTALDRCCGLGTKTLQIHALVGSQGQILATDPNQERCRGLMGLLERRGIFNVLVRPVGMLGDLAANDPQSFDRILIDAPCSNSGVFARRPEARYHQSRSALESLGGLQDRILDDTAGHLKSGGVMVYSTCSIWTQENQGRVEAFLKRHPDYRLLHDRVTLPSFTSDPTMYHDGGYFSVMARS